MGLKDILLGLLAGFGRRPVEDEALSELKGASDDTDETAGESALPRRQAKAYVILPRGGSLAPPLDDSLRIVRRDVVDLQREKERLFDSLFTQILPDSPYAILLYNEEERKNAKSAFARTSLDQFVSSLSDMLPYVAPTSLHYLIDRAGEVIEKMPTTVQLETALLNNVARYIPRQAVENKVEYTGMQFAFYSTVEQRAAGRAMRREDPTQRQGLVYSCRTVYTRLLDREERPDIEKGYNGIVMVEPYAVNWKLTQEIQAIQREKARGEALLRS